MKVFDKPNTLSGWKCPLCSTDKEKPIVLIPIYDTQEGNNIQAEQFHLDCIDLTYFKDIPVRLENGEIIKQNMVVCTFD